MDFSFPPGLSPMPRQLTERRIALNPSLAS
jgi:hypothetical protein